MTVIDNKPKQIVIIDKSGTVQYGFSENQPIYASNVALSQYAKGAPINSMLKAWDGTYWQPVKIDNSTNGAIYVSNLISGANQFGFSARVTAGAQNFYGSTRQTLFALAGLNAYDSSNTKWDYNELIDHGLKVVAYGDNGASTEALQLNSYDELQIVTMVRGVEQFGLNKQLSLFTWSSGSRLSTESIATESLMRVHDGSNFQVLKNEDGHASGKGLQVFNSILGVKQFGFQGTVGTTSTWGTNTSGGGHTSAYVNAFCHAYKSDGTRTMLYADADRNLKVTNVTHIEANIHQSKVFRSGYLWDTVSAGATKYFEITTPAKDIHFTPLIQASGEVEIEFLESPTFTTGTSVSKINADRTSSATSSCTVSRDATSVSGGTTLGKRRIGKAGTSGFWGSSEGSGGNISSDEWLLKQSTSYIIKMTNNESSEIYIQTFNQWIED